MLAVGFVGWSVFATWKDGPWDLPVAAKIDPLPAAEESANLAPPMPMSTDAIVSRNLFDPERGAGATRDAEEGSRSAQRVRNMILVGTVIIGGNRTAVLQDGTASKPAPSAFVVVNVFWGEIRRGLYLAGRATTRARSRGGAPPTPIRLKLGDNVDGYQLAEIADKKVVFTKDGARIELMLDYFRKVEAAAAPTQRDQVVPPGVATPGPRVIPNLPRRGRIPGPGAPPPSS
jgi:hypothetical protein